MNVLVTGATGFVGGRLIRLLSEAGLSPRALVRETSDTSALDRAGVPTFVANLETGEGLDAALETVSAVIHCAGGGKVRCTDDLYENNTRTTEKLLEAVTTQGAELTRFVLLSSYAAHGPRDDPRPVGADDPPEPRSHYGRSKLLAEEVTLARAKNLPVTVLRPPGIYGPGDTRLLPLFRGVQRGLVFIPSSRGLASWLHVDDCCDALLAALTTPHPSGRVYLVDDGRPRSIDQLVSSVAGAIGRDPSVFHVPLWGVNVVASLNEIWSRLSGRPGLLTRDKIRDLTVPNWIGDTGPIRRELGWTPKREFNAGIQEMTRWFVERGCLSPDK